ncbi:hypothetical protein MMC07_004339 [Pseudocyphellaria aurata]|nr:hypothetical protein [Pseudocyphellaria aurata]
MSLRLSHKRQWHRKSQSALLQFASLRSACPDGVYLCLKPGDPSQWSGILFVRDGPYAPAILRFQVSFPSAFPTLPPSITFVTDIFHPLVTPLTTYTYTTGSPSSHNVSATDEERLLPGGFSLRYGFPHWFGRAGRSTASSILSSRKASGSQEGSNKTSPEASKHRLQGSSHTLQLQDQTTFTSKLQYGIPNRSPASIIEVLEYLKSAFDDESTLDALPLEAAGNPGAWNAWQAHRKSMLRQSQHQMADNPAHVPSNKQNTKLKKQPDEWSWDGVWEERVRMGIDASISDPVLYGNPSGGDDLIRFVDANDDVIKAIKEEMLDAAALLS